MNIFKNFKNDLPASIVVFFVAIPLCLGIALASGAPLFSGLIAGIIGGVVVGIISGSPLGVSGPAAGLAAIVLTAISDLGGFNIFLVAVVLGGAMQLLFGLARAGVIANYFPSAVIKGMLTGIGLIIIIKQVPYFFGYDASLSGESLMDKISVGSTAIALVSMAILILWESVLTKVSKVFRLIQGPLVAVVVGIVYYVTTEGSESWGLTSSMLVSVPVNTNLDELVGSFAFPDFNAITNVQVWIVAFTIALVASLETLLCVEATDKLDEEKRITPKNRELIAQGIGNMFSGLIGGLPVTQVIVRSSANIQSGGKTKLSAIIHGVFLMISVFLIPDMLNKIPLSVLAAILFVVGYKLAKPALFKSMYGLGFKQFLPFVFTVIGIVFTDLLIGIGIGILVSILFILVDNYKNSHRLIVEDVTDESKKYRLVFSEEMTFVNKHPVIKELNNLPKQALLEIDLRMTKFIDHDIVEVIDSFLSTNSDKEINLKLLTERGEFNNPEDLYKAVFPSN